MHNSKEYIEVKLTFSPFTVEWAEILEAELGELPYDSFEVCDEEDSEKCLKAYIPKDLYSAHDLKVVLAGVDLDVDFTADLVVPRNWNLEWEKHFTPIVIGREVLIKSIYHDEDDIRLARIEAGVRASRFRYNIKIDPAMAFGTGHHSTTRLVIGQMLSHPRDIRGKVVLDMGCGTGVLGILAAKMGASKVYAIDIDAVAAQSAWDNARLNRQGRRIDARYGDASLLQAGSYDTILANIHKNIVIQDMGTYLRSLRKGGLLLLSGFFEQDCEEVLQEAREWAQVQGYDLTEEGREVAQGDASGKWACLAIRR